jgi:hypothetical protein
VREVLDTLEEGSATEGLARIAMLVSKAGSGHRRLSQLQRTRDFLSPEGEIAYLSEDERRRLLQEETIVVEFEPERAKKSLPKLLNAAAERKHAHALLDRIEDTHGPLDARQRQLIAELRRLLPVTGPRRAAKTTRTAAAKRKPADKPKAKARTRTPVRRPSSRA